MALVVIMWLALIPVEGAGGFPGQDKLIHFLTFSILFVLGVRAFPRSASRVWLCCGLFLYGVAMEWLQGQTTYRSMEAWDLVADGLGIALGYLLVTVYPKRIAN